MEELANYIKMVGNNEYLYNEYTKWHQEGPSFQFQKLMALGIDTSFCRICEYVAKNALIY